MSCTENLNAISSVWKLPKFERFEIGSLWVENVGKHNEL